MSFKKYLRILAEPNMPIARLPEHFLSWQLEMQSLPKAWGIAEGPVKSLDMNSDRAGWGASFRTGDKKGRIGIEYVNRECIESQFLPFDTMSVKSKYLDNNASADEVILQMLDVYVGSISNAVYFALEDVDLSVFLFEQPCIDAIEGLSEDGVPLSILYEWNYFADSELERKLGGLPSIEAMRKALQNFDDVRVMEFQRGRIIKLDSTKLVDPKAWLTHSNEILKVLARL